MAGPVGISQPGVTLMCSGLQHTCRRQSLVCHAKLGLGLVPAPPLPPWLMRPACCNKACWQGRLHEPTSPAHGLYPPHSTACFGPLASSLRPIDSPATLAKHFCTAVQQARIHPSTHPAIQQPAAAAPWLQVHAWLGRVGSLVAVRLKHAAPCTPHLCLHAWAQPARTPHTRTRTHVRMGPQRPCWAQAACALPPALTDFESVFYTPADPRTCPSEDAACMLGCPQGAPCTQCFCWSCCGGMGRVASPLTLWCCKGSCARASGPPAELVLLEVAQVLAVRLKARPQRVEVGAPPAHPRHTTPCHAIPCAHTHPGTHEG